MHILLQVLILYNIFALFRVPKDNGGTGFHPVSPIFYNAFFLVWFRMNDMLLTLNPVFSFIFL